MPDSVGLKITQKQSLDLGRDLALDMTALFNLIEDDVNDLLKKAIKEDWTPERLIAEIGDLI